MQMILEYVYFRSIVQGYTNYYSSSQYTSGPLYRGIQITTAVVSIRLVQFIGVHRLLHQKSVYVRSSVQGFTDYYTSSYSTPGPVYRGMQITDK
jgi:hypothetical protein